MTGNNILLDTNIISALLKGESIIADKIDQSSEVYIPIIVIGELYYGAEYSFQKDTNLANIFELTETYTILPVDLQTSSVYGLIKATLRKKGTPIPENDIWIAALSKQHDLTLITRDKHFNNIPELIIQSW